MTAANLGRLSSIARMGAVFHCYAVRFVSLGKDAMDRILAHANSVSNPCMNSKRTKKEENALCIEHVTFSSVGAVSCQAAAFANCPRGCVCETSTSTITTRPEIR